MLFQFGGDFHGQSLAGASGLYGVQVACLQFEVLNSNPTSVSVFLRFQLGSRGELVAPDSTLTGYLFCNSALTHHHHDTNGRVDHSSAEEQDIQDDPGNRLSGAIGLHSADPFYKSGNRYGISDQGNDPRNNRDQSQHHACRGPRVGLGRRVHCS